MQDTDVVNLARLCGEDAQASADWRRMHRVLREAEQELALTSRLHAMGSASTEQLDAASEKVVALRELSLAVLARLRNT